MPFKVLPWEEKFLRGALSRTGVDVAALIDCPGKRKNDALTAAIAHSCAMRAR